MTRLIAILLSATALWAASSPATARNRMNWGPSSLQLAEGMTEQQAIKAVGYSPDKAELQTCGTEAPSGPWTCRIITFGDSYNHLTVFERDDADDGDRSVGLHMWVVNHWIVSD
jgi:hypothetical protein